MKYAIYDWTGSELTAHGYFDSFHDAWEYILGDMTDRLGLTEDDYCDYQVKGVSVSRYPLFRSE